MAEGGALLRRYVGEYLHRGFESLLLRWRGGRAVECGGLENRYPSFGGSRVQIPPPPLPGKRSGPEALAAAGPLSAHVRSIRPEEFTAASGAHYLQARLARTP